MFRFQYGTSLTVLTVPSPSGIIAAGLGYKLYFSHYSNWFDAVIVVSSFIEIGVGGASGVCTLWIV